jgi:hypothetical protein
MGNMKNKPKHCKGCFYHNNAGHPKGSVLGNSKYNNWCCHYGNYAPKVVGKCKNEGHKNIYHLIYD